MKKMFNQIFLIKKTNWLLSNKSR